eukprot:1895604-Rhodomonas_salina.2
MEVDGGGAVTMISTLVLKTVVLAIMVLTPILRFRIVMLTRGCGVVGESAQALQPVPAADCAEGELRYAATHPRYQRSEYDATGMLGTDVGCGATGAVVLTWRMLLPVVPEGGER